MKDRVLSISASGVLEDYRNTARCVPSGLRSKLPLWLRHWLNQLYWFWWCGLVDYVAEVTGWLLSHGLRGLIYRHILGIRIGASSSVHRGCRFYRPAGVQIGAHSIINRDVLLDGRMGLHIGENVSISEGAILLSLEHDPQSPTFEDRGGPLTIEDYAFVGARAMLLPGVTVCQVAVVAAGAVVTHDVEPYTIVGGVPARVIGQRTRELTYVLDYRKFLG
jgi:acetyltransferase-like isoleucine patch superfamily enzyme